MVLIDYFTIFGILIAGYVLGSLPFGLWLTNFAGLDDIRTIGSGNIGATNVLRTGNKGIAIATLLADVLKGTAAVLIGNYLYPEGGLLAGLAAFVGHLHPVWLGFKGGKGVATYIGVLLGLYWTAALLFCTVWLATALLFRYSSVSSLASTLIIPPSFYFLGKPLLAILFLCMTALVFLNHDANIVRLLTGKESKIGPKEH